MPYLIYASKEAALERADEEGKEIGYSYWIQGVGTRWHTYPKETDDHMWALDVTEYDLDDSEKSSTVDNYTPLPTED
tara:strand:- start:660 stop:890 length:231 start_codon:yes stop_codon:yes gene_type:complete